MKRYLIPLALFLALAGFLARGLTRDPHELPSPLIGRQAPLFELPQLQATAASFTPASMRGQVWLLNVWASWCGACRQEHPVLMALAKRGDVPLVGLDYKDAPADAQRLLAQHGDPYRLSAVDRDGRAGMDYGVYGVPETYLIDRDGIIRFKQVGPLTEAVLRDKLMPLVKELRK
ncbi:DsbE family thiol:disulfide interchange protein [Aquincola sp. S2]|uniref:DsbE family thiol:disulfide interchange protein n=1 Tax=Pseudaquabacterium terrae TaxID=2732868 RepID=A0ABX2EQZ8_9BURK|nr:DsbE family thiol:disulfide interchange protein [Aquabacterium terrae]NRF71061.1 DsbE family thiol:disulfide interchange protein [Aquabacterium terrae]